MGDNDILEVFSSPIRWKIIQLLSLRARSIPELTIELNITTQAVLKHLRTLKKHKIIRVSNNVRYKFLGIKQIITLNTAVETKLETDRGIKWFEIKIGDPTGVIWGNNKSKRTDLKNIEDIEEEKYSLKRRIRSIKIIERKLIRKLFELEAIKKDAIDKNGFDGFEELLLNILLSFSKEKDMEDISNSLKCKKEELIRVIESFEKKMI